MIDFIKTKCASSALCSILKLIECFKVTWTWRQKQNLYDS